MHFISFEEFMLVLHGIKLKLVIELSWLRPRRVRPWELVTCLAPDIFPPLRSGGSLAPSTLIALFPFLFDKQLHDASDMVKNDTKLTVAVDLFF